MVIALYNLIENRASIDYMYGPMAGVGANIKKRIPKWMDLEVSTMEIKTTKNII